MTWTYGWDGVDGCWFIPEVGCPACASPHGLSVSDEANARLIAAAPDTLEALKNLVASAVNDSDGCVICNGDNKHWSGCPVETALAAIAKAEAR